jgi:hypothetical protein
MKEQEDCGRFHARIANDIEKQENEHAQESESHKFRVSEQKENNKETMSKPQRIVGQQVSLRHSDHSYNGSRWNVMIEWETRMVTAEPLSKIVANDPVTCAIYDQDKDLLDEPGWKRFKGIAKRDKKMLRQVHRAKLRSFRGAS